VSETIAEEDEDEHEHPLANGHRRSSFFLLDSGDASDLLSELHQDNQLSLQDRLQIVR
jgi:hypothetical protein